MASEMFYEHLNTWKAVSGHLNIKQAKPMSANYTKNGQLGKQAPRGSEAGRTNYGQYSLGVGREGVLGLDVCCPVLPSLTTHYPTTKILQSFSNKSYSTSNAGFPITAIKRDIEAIPLHEPQYSPYPQQLSKTSRKWPPTAPSPSSPQVTTTLKSLSQLALKLD
jgi:hypothetical protein